VVASGAEEVVEVDIATVSDVGDETGVVVEVELTSKASLEGNGLESTELVADVVEYSTDVDTAGSEVVSATDVDTASSEVVGATSDEIADEAASLTSSVELLVNEVG